VFVFEVEGNIVPPPSTQAIFIWKNPYRRHVKMLDIRTFWSSRIVGLWDLIIIIKYILWTSKMDVLNNIGMMSSFLKGLLGFEAGAKARPLQTLVDPSSLIRQGLLYGSEGKRHDSLKPLSLIGPYLWVEP